MHLVEHLQVFHDVEEIKLRPLTKLIIEHLFKLFAEFFHQLLIRVVSEIVDK